MSDERLALSGPPPDPCRTGLALSGPPPDPCRTGLDGLLRELPRETAGRDFTARVLARLDAPAPERPATPWLARLAVPVAAAVVLAAGLLTQAADPGPAGPGSTAEARRILAEIRREHGELASELQALRDLRDDPVYVGGDEEVDLVLDLDRLHPAGAEARAMGEIRPAARTRP